MAQVQRTWVPQAQEIVVDADSEMERVAPIAVEASGVRSTRNLESAINGNEGLNLELIADTKFLVAAPPTFCEGGLPGISLVAPRPLFGTGQSPLQMHFGGGPSALWIFPSLLSILLCPFSPLFVHLAFVQLKTNLQI